MKLLFHVKTTTKMEKLLNFAERVVNYIADSNGLNNASV